MRSPLREVGGFFAFLLVMLVYGVSWLFHKKTRENRTNEVLDRLYQLL